MVSQWTVLNELYLCQPQGFEAECDYSGYQWALVLLSQGWKTHFFSTGLCFLWNKSTFLVNTACSNFMLLIVLIDKCVGRLRNAGCVCPRCRTITVQAWIYVCMCICFRSAAFFQRHLLGVRNPGSCFQSSNSIPHFLSTRRLNLVETRTSLEGIMYQCVCTSVIPCHVCEVIFLKHNSQWKTVGESAKWRWP